MENPVKKEKRFVHSLTFKVIVIGVMTLLMLIPNAMIQNLILERQMRSEETIEKINSQWSHAQTLCAPLLCIPYETISEKQKVQRLLYITPEHLDIKVRLYPERRHFGIYHTILYKSEITILGNFSKTDMEAFSALNLQWHKACLAVGLSDLRGVSNVDFSVQNKKYEMETSAHRFVLEKALVVHLNDLSLLQNSFDFKCELSLNGSSYISFIPVGKTTQADVSGEWSAPGFMGAFSPEHNITKEDFHAQWNVLYFNRDIPESWKDNEVSDYQLRNSSFGVNLIKQVDHYQQNMRSSKYALMFIALTFVVFFFVETLTKKKIHPFQYLLVGIAIILFYSLLLSISEQINFRIAYLIASSATIGLITLYSHTIFKKLSQTFILFFILCGLYLFLFVTLQLEDLALLIGSSGLFLILAVVMYFSRKIGFYRQEELPAEEK
ncbi:MAG: cell envelope integrity protein CreD [Lentimicrobiaceae bacterium]|nr:cell envelope integrity protein CreD [Lentimicrobiaceae bacterium]MCL2246624.1 cell envelope integrity protein CreD [Lentimicrobiaceae bacterium]